MERAVPITGQSPPCSAPLDRGNKARGGPIRMLGSGPEKKRRSLFPLLSTPLLSSPLPLLSSCSLPVGSSSREAKPPLLCGDTYVFRGQTDFRPGACTEGERTGHANSHTETVQLGNNTQRNQRGKRTPVWSFSKKKTKKKKGENPFRNTEKIKSSYCSEGKRAFYRILFHVFITFVNIAVMHIIR